MVDEYTDESLKEGSSGDEADPLEILGSALLRKYRIERYIGRGGFGHVYLASNLELFDQKVVVKFLKRPEEIDRFRLEAAIQANLDHPNICGVQAYLRDQKAIVIPFIDGADCERLLHESGPMSEERVVKIALALARALVYAHANEVYHRDLKPSNIMVDRHGHVRLIDFGIAKRTSHHLTEDRPTPGTWAYLPPEQLDDDAADDPAQRDIYALGVTLFQLCTGVRLRHERLGASPNHWGGEAARRLSSEFRSFLRRLTESNKADRFQDMTEVLAALEALPEPRRGRRLRRVLLFVGIPVVLAVVLYAGTVYIRGSEQERAVSARTDDTVTAATLSVDDSVLPVEEGLAVDTAARSTDSSETGTGGGKDSVARSTEPKSEDDEEPSLVDSNSPSQRKDTAKLETAADVRQMPTIDSLSVWVEALPDPWIGLEFDGRRVSPDQGVIKTVPGMHEFRIVNARYPIKEDFRYLSRDTVIKVDAARDFARADRIDLKVGCVPYPVQPIRLTLTCNGIREELEGIPATVRGLPVGTWSMSFEMSELSDNGNGSRLTVDSFMVKQTAMRVTPAFVGDSATVDFDVLRTPGEDNMKIVVYWTAKPTGDDKL